MTTTSFASLAHLDHAERAIIAAVVTKALANGWAISVNDGEEWAVKTSTDAAAILSEIAATDMTTLVFRAVTEGAEPKAWPKVGAMSFVHGNGEDVIHDHSDNAEMEALAKHAISAA